jgi:hypothetical protein
MTLSISSVQSGHLIRIAGVGTCGESSLSLYVKSNHAYASQGVPQGVNVGWDGLEFQGKDSLVSEYHIWKEDSNHVLTMVGTVGGLFHSYTDVSGGGLIYIVGAIVSAKGIQTEYLSNIVDNNVGIQTHDKIDFSIYPNPASNVIHITSSENLTTFIYDINGNLVRSSTDKDINIEDVPSGEYCMKVINATTGISGYKPFIITH